MAYALLRFLFSQATRAFFKLIEVEGLDRIPARGPLLVLPNHPNGVVDPLLVLIFLRRPVSLVAKSTLTRVWGLGLLFRLAHVVLVHRRQDQAEGADPSKNAASLEEVRKRLARGGAVLMFPEGISHNQPRLQPLKTGAARAALDYVDKDGDPGGLKIVPVGIAYTEKQRFRSSALVRVGEPMDASAWRRAHPQAGAHELTDEVAARLRGLTLNFERRKESVILMHAARLLLTQGREPVAVGRLKEEAGRLIGTIEELQARTEALLAQGRGAEVAALGARIRVYAARLAVLGLHPREVYLDLSPFKALWFLLRESLALGLGLPLALWGLLHHFIPYALCWALTRLLSKQRDNWASYAIFSAVFVFPAWFALLGGLLWLNTGALFWCFYMALLPLSLFAALRFRDRGLAVFKRAAAFLLLVLRPGLKRELRQEGGALLQAIRHLSQQAGAALAPPS